MADTSCSIVSQCNPAMASATSLSRSERFPLNSPARCVQAASRSTTCLASGGRPGNPLTIRSAFAGSAAGCVASAELTHSRMTMADKAFIQVAMTLHNARCCVSMDVSFARGRFPEFDLVALWIDHPTELALLGFFGAVFH